MSYAARETGGRVSAPAAFASSGPASRKLPEQSSQTTTANPLDSGQAAPTAAAPPKKTRKRLNKELAQAARDRKRDQHYANMRNPPNDKDVWICEFCEYESIFGQPPAALIRKYELKDRRLRKEAAERQRLLQKAKMQSRKGKKTGKSAAAKTNAPAQDRTTPQGDANAPPIAPGPGQEPDDEYYEDEEYEDHGQELGTEDGTPVPGEEGHDGGDGTEGHRPLRPPTATRPISDGQAPTASS